MQFLTLAEIQPVIRIANYHSVAPGQSWLKRYIPDLQLIFIIHGEYAYWEEGEPPVSLAPGEVFLIEPNRCHTFQHTSVAESGCICSIHFEFTGTRDVGGQRLSPYANARAYHMGVGQRLYARTL